MKIAFLTRVFTRIVVLPLCCVTALVAVAAPADPPGRVGRVSFIDGEVSFFNDPAEGWRRATLNYPVTSQNSIWTDGSARAEVRIGPSAIRLDHDSVVDFLVVDDERTRILVQRGAVNIRLRSIDGSDSRDTFTLETNQGRFTLDGDGRYRVDAGQDGQDSRATVYAGRARFAGTGQDLSVDTGRSLLIRSLGTSADVRFETVASNAFDQWSLARDQAWDDVHSRYASTQTISPEMTGYEELDRYGEWVDNREYGRLWTPTRVLASWAPYRYGHWSFVRPWGWTWVDDSPWGFAPFHYGRWVVLSSRWYWSPGSYWRRPVYAPALVAWHGAFPAHGASFSTVGWFPLGPREHYVPHYTANLTYIRNINRVHDHRGPVKPPLRYVNRDHGPTHVPHQIFANRGAVGSNVVRVNGEPVISAMPPLRTKPLALPRDVGTAAPQVAGAPAAPAAIVPTSPVAVAPFSPAPSFRTKPAEARTAPAPNPAVGSNAASILTTIAATPPTASAAPRKPSVERAPAHAAPHVVASPEPAAPVRMHKPRGRPEAVHSAPSATPPAAAVAAAPAKPERAQRGGERHERPERNERQERHRQPGAIQ